MQPLRGKLLDGDQLPFDYLERWSTINERSALHEWPGRFWLPAAIGVDPARKYCLARGDGRAGEMIMDRFGSSDIACPSVLGGRHASLSQRSEQNQRRLSDPEDRVFQRLRQDGACQGVAWFRDEKGAGGDQPDPRVRVCDQVLHHIDDRFGRGQFECPGRVHPQAVVGVGRTLDQERDGRGRDDVEPGQRVREFART